MRAASRQLAAVACLWVALPACAPKESKIAVKIITTSCDSKSDPFVGVKFVRLRVIGEGIEPARESIAPAIGEKTINIPSIPAGKNRIIDVRGFDADPSAGAAKVISVGKSLPFDVLDTIDPANNEPIQISIFLRKVNAFTPPSSASAPKECTRMKLPRAAHTATLLKNGKVFVAGGFSFASGTTNKVAIAETELYNPATNSFESARELSVSSGNVKLGRAFHSATGLVSGQVLIWGGESYVAGAIYPTAINLIYDPGANEYGALPPRRAPEPDAIPRTRHKAVLDKNGKVLIAGGERRLASMVPVDEVEWFDPATNEYKVVPGVMLPRREPAVAAVNAGQLVVVAGGTDGTAMANEVVYFKWDAAGFKREVLASPPRLAMPGRRGASAATLRNGLDLLVLGGYSDPDPSKVTPISTSEIVGTSTTMVTPGPQVTSSSTAGRGDICSVQLTNGTVLAIGGLTVDAAGAPGRSDGSTTVIKSTGAGAAEATEGPALSVPRYLHTCTLLSDGSVLVLGGLNEQITSHDILQDAWIYQPAPTDP